MAQKTVEDAVHSVQPECMVSGRVSNPPVPDDGVESDGQPVSEAATLTQRSFHPFPLTPGKPFVKATRLSARPTNVVVTPEK